MRDRFICHGEDLLQVLDALLAEHSDDTWWDGFYADRARPIPFFVDHPDESLPELLSHASGGRALDLGCGNGRNSHFLSRRGWRVDGVDHSETAIAWAAEKAATTGSTVQLHCKSVFDFRFEPGQYDLVYDSGCFHHMAPHRRGSYIDLVASALRPGGWFGLTCFAPEGGSGLTDLQVYERRSTGYGLGYTEAQLRQLWSPGFDVRLLRRMVKPPAGAGLFGETFLWVLFAQRRTTAAAFEAPGRA